MSLPLLATKLQAPRPGRDRLSRPRLLRSLDAVLNHPVALVSAPAGYGKTALVAEWIAASNRPAAWLSLDSGDNDPARFLTYLVAALQTIDAPLGRETLAGLQAHPAPPLPALLSSLLNEISALPQDSLLVFDDYHLIEAQPVHAAVTFLFDHQPPPLHLIIASRADPPLPLARLRAGGQLVEVRQSDLRFTLAETTAFLNEVRGLGLAADDVGVLASRTEGWIAGLHLAAMSLHALGDAHRFVQEFKGSHRYVLDYLIEEVLQRQSPDVHDFLLQTSILDRLTGPLCDAVVGRDGGQAALERLEHANLFIVPLDEERRWYRYHRLFVDLLQKRLGETHPLLAPTLHLRASVWHEQNGLMAEAIDHALAAKDFERAAGLIEQIAEATMMRSESATLFKWINALPEAGVRARPALCVYQAWVMLLNGSPLTAVEARLSLGGPSLLVLPLQALMAVYRGDMAAAIELAQRAQEQLPETEAFMRGMAGLVLGAAYHTQGDIAASQRALQEITGRHLATNVVIAVTALCYRADFCRREGRLRQAYSLYQQALDLANDKGGSRLPIAGRALIGLGDVAREWNQLETATRQLLEGIDLIGRWAQAGALGAYLALARIRQAEKDWDGVREALQSMRQVAVEFKATEVDDRFVDLAEAWMQIAQGDRDGPRRWAERYGLAGTVDPLALEQDHDIVVRHLHKYEYPILARLWIAEGRPAEALALLESASPVVEKLSRIGLMIEYDALIGLAAQALGQNAKALQALERALALAEPEGFARIFVDEGKPMARLLHEAAARGIRPEYAGRLLAAFSASAPPAPRPAGMVEPLSERELQVLQLIAEGLSNEAVAQRLVLSLPTIKWHTSNIYGKLNVKNRTEAVAKARSLGLLPLA